MVLAIRAYILAEVASFANSGCWHVIHSLFTGLNTVPDHFDAVLASRYTDFISAFLIFLNQLL